MTRFEMGVKKTGRTRNKETGIMPALLNAHLSMRDFLVGQRFTAADAYLVWFLALSARAQVPIAGYPHLEAYFAKQVTRPKIATLIADDQAARSKS